MSHFIVKERFVKHGDQNKARGSSGQINNWDEYKLCDCKINDANGVRNGLVKFLIYFLPAHFSFLQVRLV